MLYTKYMPLRRSITVRLSREDAAALARARKDGLNPSQLIREGLRTVAALYYPYRRAPSTGLFSSTDADLGDESETFRHLEE